MREDWVECTFDEVLDIKNGKNQKLVEDIDGAYPIYGSSGVIGKAKEFLCPENTTIIGRKGTINSPIFVTTKFWNVDTAFGLIPSDVLNAKLLFYFSKYFNFHSLDKSTTIPSLAKSDLLKINFPLPPLPEQRAIVKKIEALFSSLDAGISDLKKAQDQLKVYRQAVLKKAFEGETEIKLLKEIAEVKRGKSKHRPRNDKKLFGGPYPFIQTGEVRKANGGIIKNFGNTYSEFGLQQSKLWPKGTLCLTIAANIGETAFLGFDACFPDSVVGIKADETILNINYFNYFIQLTKSELDRKASATAQKNINLEFLEALEIPIYSIQEQAQIVKEIESRLSVCDDVEQQIKKSLSQAETLRQSILKKAFEGKLLSEAEIQACQQEPDYEPASVLLEKIKAEKEANKPSKNTKKK